MNWYKTAQLQVYKQFDQPRVVTEERTAATWAYLYVQVGEDDESEEEIYQRLLVEFEGFKKGIYQTFESEMGRYGLTQKDIRENFEFDLGSSEEGVIKRLYGQDNREVGMVACFYLYVQCSEIYHEWINVSADVIEDILLRKGFEPSSQQSS